MISIPLFRFVCIIGLYYTSYNFVDYTVSRPKHDREAHHLPCGLGNEFLICLLLPYTLHQALNL